LRNILYEQVCFVELKYDEFVVLVLLKCDVALRVYLQHIDRNATDENDKFIILQLDEAHLFIKDVPQIRSFLQSKIDEWHEANTYAIPTNTAAYSSSDKKMDLS